MYCTRCGTENREGGSLCAKCGAGMEMSLTPKLRLPPRELPQMLAANLTPLQQRGLAFAVRNMTVISAVIQTFNLGSHGSGSVHFAGLGRSMGPWGVFGGLGTVQHESVNSFRTDIQLKLEDDSGRKAFLATNLPFAVTLAIQPGETVRLYFVKGGLRNPRVAQDFCIHQWLPFAAENTTTGQVIPIRGLPTLVAPSHNEFLVIARVCAVFGSFTLLSGLSTMFASLVAGSVVTMLGLSFWATAYYFFQKHLTRKRKYEQDLAEAQHTAEAVAI